MRTRIKICGITRVEDEAYAVELGVDAIGLVFYEKSARAVTLAQAQKIVASIAPFVTTVGLFLDAAPKYVRQVLESIPLDLLQFHGDERPEDCFAFRRPYIKAMPMGSGINAMAYAAAYPDASGYLLDSHAQGAAGGSGKRFNWDLSPRDLNKPIILAGGLTTQNVAAAIDKIHPYAVDVSSGVESEKGIKDPTKMLAFVRVVKHVDNDQS